jgi:hypothetical protein
MFSFIEINSETWHKHWKNVARANILQSWEYGQAKCSITRFRSRHFLLQDRQMRPQGLLQVLYFPVPLIGGLARINQGPVFFSDSWQQNCSQASIRGVIGAILEIARRYRWWYLSIIPNFLANEETACSLKKLGFSKKNVGLLSSAMICIDKKPEDIRAGFHSKWRNLLTKSEKMHLQLEIPPVGNKVSCLISNYEEMQHQKDFSGLPTKLVYQIVKEKGTTWNPRIFFALQNGQHVGRVMVVGHGDTCTYLIGWTSELGRNLQANYYLLWQAILYFHKLGYRYFDVGGLGAHTTEGVAHFKKRMKGEEYVLVGDYSYSVLAKLFRKQ